jgi:hypothetical protein
MAVSVRGKVYKLRVRPGPEGKEDFKRQIRALLGFSPDMDFDVIFECKTPHNGARVACGGPGMSAVLLLSALHTAAVRQHTRTRAPAGRPTPADTHGHARTPHTPTHTHRF